MITANVTWAQANLDVNTPGITAITSSMKARNGQLQGAYASGAVGFSKDGNVTVRDAAAGHELNGHHFFKRDLSI